MRLLAQVLAAILLLLSGLAGAQVMPFSFGVLASGSMGLEQERLLRSTIVEADAANLAFVVAQGITGPGMRCNDNVYQRRKALLDASKHGLFPSASAKDWAVCGEATSPSAAVARLTRLRELFFTGEFSLGATRLPLVRQSTEPKFHSFVENMRWEVGSVMFATVNLPANNNNYLEAAGRNGEFEDRLVANREWLRRIFTYAHLLRSEAIVLFSEANPMERASRGRDGFEEIRRTLQELSSEFGGSVLLVHARESALERHPALRWQGRLGTLGVAQGWVRLRFTPGAYPPFMEDLPLRLVQ